MGGKEIRKLTNDETNSISGGDIIVKVSLNDLKKENLNLKPYLVVSDYDCQIIGSYDTFEEAYSKGIDYEGHIPKAGMQILKEGKLGDYLLQSANGNDYYLVLDWHQEV